MEGMCCPRPVSISLTRHLVLIIVSEHFLPQKWVIEQPVQPVQPVHQPIPATPSPRSTKTSYYTETPIPFIPPIPISPFMSVQSAQSAQSAQSSRCSPHSPLSSTQPIPPTRTNSADTRATGSSTRVQTESITPSLRKQDGEYVVYNTESIRALHDVELAVDESTLAMVSKGDTDQPRRTTSQPRLSTLENPFIDWTARLGSRRVRPLILELIQALGHYIDAVWQVTYPDRTCPWISPEHNGKVGSKQNKEIPDVPDIWRSKMITAVQQGKKQGHVNDRPTHEDVSFWEDEVRHAVRDVDEVVGIYKGVPWAFDTALKDGGYGNLDAMNVLGLDGKGGNMARLLNDLEEAIWWVFKEQHQKSSKVLMYHRGDAAPRPTDLAYDLPLDFDPYAVPDDTEVSMATTASYRGSSNLAAMFSESNGPDQSTESHNQPISHPLNDESTSTSPQVDIMCLPDIGGKDLLSLDAYRVEGEDVSLEEIGKRRHREWVLSRRAEIAV